MVADEIRANGKGLESGVGGNLKREVGSMRCSLKKAKAAPSSTRSVSGIRGGVRGRPRTGL